MTYIAVDIGATNIRVASGDEKGIHLKLSESTDQENGPEGVSKQIIRLLKNLESDVLAISIGSIGPIDFRKGIITNTPNYPFNQINIVEPLHEEFGVPVSILNDCAAGVLGEKVFGAGKDVDNLVYVTISTGLGGGAIVDGHLLSGKDGNAPEIGHLVVQPDSDLICGCGGRGHWEAFSSGNNIPRFASSLLQEKDWINSSLYSFTRGDLTLLDSKMIFDEAKKGDQVSLEIVEEIGKINAVGFADIVNVFDPELITVGGSIALNNPQLILDPIKKGIYQYLINRKPEIQITPLGEDVVLYGALAHSLRRSN